MKRVSFFLALSFYGLTAVSQDSTQTEQTIPLPQVANIAQPLVYKTTCINSVDEKLGFEGRGVSKSWDRTVKIHADEASVTKTFYLTSDCKDVLRKHIYLGIVVNSLNQNEKEIDIQKVFAIHQGPFSEEVLRVTGYTEALDETNMNPSLRSAGSDVNNPSYYIDNSYIVSNAAGGTTSLDLKYRTRIKLSPDVAEIIYLNKTMYLQK